MAKTSAAMQEQMLSKQQRARQKQAQIHTEQSSAAAAEKRAARRPLRAVALIVCVCMSLGGILALRAYNIELGYDILSVQRELTEAQSVYIAMQNELDALASEQGRDQATIGMQEASLSQIEYIDLTTENHIEVMEELSVWEQITGFFGGLFE